MTTVIIEDEATAARRLRKLIKQLDATVSVVAELDSVEESVDYFERHPQPDLIFMDIHLADGSSFEIFGFVAVTAPVIFTTAYDEYALRAFSANAIDYLLKPVKVEELRRALDKYRQLHREPVPQIDYGQLAASLRPAPADRRFLLRIGTRLKVVGLREVAYFYTHDKITFLVTEAGKRYPVDPSLEELEASVPAKEFFRINRQFIVRLAAIAEMHAYSKSRVKLLLSPPCRLETIVSTERSPHFKRWLSGE